MIPWYWVVVALVVGWWCGGIARGRSLRTVHRRPDARHRRPPAQDGDTPV